MHTCSGFLCFHTRSIIHKKCVEIQAIRQDIISDVVATNAEMVKGDWDLPFQCKLHWLQVCVHTNIHSCIQHPLQSTTWTWALASKEWCNCNASKTHHWHIQNFQYPSSTRQEKATEDIHNPNAQTIPICNSRIQQNGGRFSEHSSRSGNNRDDW